MITLFAAPMLALLAAPNGLAGPSGPNDGGSAERPDIVCVRAPDVPAGAAKVRCAFVFAPGPKLTVGDPIEAQLRVVHPSGTIAHLSDIPALGAFDAEVLSHDRKELGSEALDVWKLRIAAFEPGTVTLQPLGARVDSIGRSDAGKVASLRIATPEVAVTIESVITDPDAGFLDYAGPVPLVRTVWWRVALASAAIIALIGAAIVLLRRRRERALQPVPPPPPRPAEIVAREAIAQLVGEKLLLRGEYKSHFARLSEIVRGYLEARFHILALERTTTELVPELAQALGHRDPRLEIAEMARELLDTCDLVKFAKHTPSSTASQATLNQSLALIERTTESAVVNAR